MMRHLLVTFCMLFLLLGCSDGQGPETSDAIRKIGDQLNSVPSKYFQINGLTYRHGTAQGADRYVVSVRYDVAFKMSLADIKKDYENIKDGPVANTDFVISILLVYKDANVGDTFSTQKDFLFEKSGGEWLLRGEAR
jgi:hypothetical protein